MTLTVLDTTVAVFAAGKAAAARVKELQDELESLQARQAESAQLR